MKRLLRADVLLPLILLAGMAQYAMVAVGVMVSGEASLWQLEETSLNTAGPLRYVKDLLVVCLSFAWLYYLPKLGLPKGLIGLVKVYFLWMAGVIIIGSLGFLLGYSPLFFFPAGLRWLFLLHAALGVFLLTSTLVTAQHRHRFIFRFLVAIVLIDAYAVLLQLQTVSSLFGLAFGAARLTGLFSNAGVAAFFSLAVALFVALLDGVDVRKRIVTMLLCMFLALSSGTRFATISIFIIILIQLWEMAETSGPKLKGRIRILFVPIFALAIVYGYQSLNQQVNRGDAITQQFEKGGRVGNVLNAIDMLYSADLVEVMVGRGLGIATNTAITANLSDGIDPGIYRFNQLVDNGFMTGIFQFGLLGSILFWTGIFKFIRFVKPKYSKQSKYRYYGVVTIITLTLLAGNPFEQYFLMMSYAASLGAAYWSDRVEYQKMLLKQI